MGTDTVVVKKFTDPYEPKKLKMRDMVALEMRLYEFAITKINKDRQIILSGGQNCLTSVSAEVHVHNIVWDNWRRLFDLNTAR